MGQAGVAPSRLGPGLAAVGAALGLAWHGPTRRALKRPGRGESAAFQDKARSAHVQHEVAVGVLTQDRTGR